MALANNSTVHRPQHAECSRMYTAKIRQLGGLVTGLGNEQKTGYRQDFRQNPPSDNTSSFAERCCVHRVRTTHASKRTFECADVDLYRLVRTSSSGASIELALTTGFSLPLGKL